MTTKNQPRRPARHAQGGEPDAATPVTANGGEPTVGERLRTAREAKGVDYYRIERDTKIRAKYLSGLERGDYAALPGDVYTKGFLRNYALYLGLDGDEIAEAWREERAEAATREPSIGGPQPIAMPKRRFVLLPNHFFIVLVVLVVAAFGTFFVWQISRLMQPVTVGVTTPAAGRVEVSSTTTTYLLTGTATADVAVEISWDGQPPTKVKADSAGHWSYLASLHAGVNQFDITARNADTQHHSETVVRLIDVPVSSASPSVPGLVLTSPEDGAIFQNNTVEVTGKTVAVTTVTITPVYLGPPPPPSASPTPAASPSASPTFGESASSSGSTITASPSPTPTLRPSPSPTPSPTPLPTAYPTPSGGPSGSPGPIPVSKTVLIDGTFDIPIQLPAGRWLLTVTGLNAQGQETPPVTRTVTVAYSNVEVVLEIKDASTVIRLWKNDGSGDVVVSKWKTYKPGAKVSVSGLKWVTVEIGCSSTTYVTVNGWSYGHLSKYCVTQKWRLTATALPKQVP